jgi:DNA-binding MarR family transcriptional regulator
MRTDTAPSRLRSLPSWLLKQAARPAQRLGAEALRSVDAQRSHVSVLAALDEFGPASQADLGRRCAIDRSDMVALINDLSGRGLVRREPDPADRRRNVITITGDGRDRLGALQVVLTDVQDRLLAPLSSDERRQLVRLLTQIVDHHAAS